MSSRPADVAIIGMACLFPGARDLRSYWENILAGVDCISDPPDGWSAERVRDPSSTENDRLYTTRGGYLGSAVAFEATRFGVMPRSIEGSEPEQFVALQLAHDALADAGYLDRPFDRRKVGVILGRGTYVNRGLVSCLQHTVIVDQVLDLLRRLHPEHSESELAELKRSLKANLPPLNAETVPGLAHSVMCGRIANRLDLMGPAFTVDAACSSSLVALDYAIRDIESGVCDMVLAGGIQISTTHPIAALFAQLGAVSRSGHIRPFHPEADGLLLGEGAGIVLLKRREDAQRDGDRIYAVVRGVGTSSDGKAMGILAPRVEGEELAMRRAYEASGVDPTDVALIEAHGTGTPVGDATEIEAMLRVFGGGGTRPRCAVGSVKSMIGHSIPAAAAAGLIKVALAVYHKVLPPTLHALPHPRLAGTPLYLNTQTRPWIHGGPGPRRAAISAFGFGGINSHAVLEEVREPAPSGRAITSVPGTGAPASLHARRDSELFVVEARDRAGLLARIGQLREFVANHPDASPCDLAFTLNVPVDARTDAGGAAPARLAVVASTLDELDRKLAGAGERLRDASRRRIKGKDGVYYFEEKLAGEGTVAFVFPGEGAQYPGMLADLCLHFPEARGWFDLMDRAFRDHPRGFRPSEVLFPAPGGQAADRLFEMDSAIESVFASNQALLAILTRLGVRPAVVAGHSTGEYSALLAAGAVAIEGEDALIDQILAGNQATERALARGLVPPGVLLAVGPADPERIREVVAASNGALDLAMDNCPHQAVLCGDEEAIEHARAALRAHAVVCQQLPFARAYHTPRFEPVCAELRPYYDGLAFRVPDVPLYSCATAARVPDDPGAIRELALAQWARPVRFRETVEAMYEDGARIFVEVGPRGNLTAFIEDTLRGRPHLAIASNIRARAGITQLHHLLGLLAAHGVDLTLLPLYESRPLRRLDTSAAGAGAAADRPRPSATSLSLALPELRVDDELAARFARVAGPFAAASPTVPAGVPVAAPAPAVAAHVEPGGARAAKTSAVTAAGAHGEASGERDRVMQAYLKTMDLFLATQGRVMEVALRRRGNGSARPTGAEVREVAPAATLPLLGDPIPVSEAGATRFRRTLSLTEEVFLGAHRLGGRMSIDPTLGALPVCPLTFSLEMVAEAASATFPDDNVVGLSSIRVHRWLAFTGPEITVEVTARPRPGARGAVDVVLEELMPAPDGRPPGTGRHAFVVVEATVLLGRRPASPPAAEAFPPLQDARAPRWRPEELYAEGMTHGMFHGWPFRGVRAIERIGVNGIEGRLAGMDPAGLLRSCTAPRFVIDPLLLDAAGQLIGYWTADTLENGFVVFPVEVERVEFPAPPLPPGAEATGRVRITALDEGHLVADLEVVDGHGRVRLRARGWRDRRYRMPGRVYSFRLDPLHEAASTRWQTPVAGRPDAACCRIDLPPEGQGADADFWRMVLAWLALCPAEREEFLALRADESRRTAWLLGRVAAKDAARLLLRERHGIELFPADVHVCAEPGGRLVLAGEWAGRVPRVPAVSVSHTGGVVVAIAVDADVRGAGVDVERLRPLDPSFEEVAFDDAERSLLSRVPGERREEWLLRLWCAKEAAGKALGTGLAGDPRSLAIRALEDDTAGVRVVPAGSRNGGPGLLVRTGRDGDLVYATAVDELREA